MSTPLVVCYLDEMILTMSCTETNFWIMQDALLYEDLFYRNRDRHFFVAPLGRDGRFPFAYSHNLAICYCRYARLCATPYRAVRHNSGFTRIILGHHTQRCTSLWRQNQFFLACNQLFEQRYNGNLCLYCLILISSCQGGLSLGQCLNGSIFHDSYICVGRGPYDLFRKVDRFAICVGPDDLQRLGLLDVQLHCGRSDFNFGNLIRHSNGDFHDRCSIFALQQYSARCNAFDFTVFQHSRRSGYGPHNLRLTSSSLPFARVMLTFGRVLSLPLTKL